MFLLRLLIRELLILLELVIVVCATFLHWLKSRPWRRSWSVVPVAIILLTVSALGLAPSSEAWNKRISQRYLSEARAAVAAGDANQAEFKYRRAIQKDGNSPELMFEYAKSLQILGKKKEAIEQFAVIAPVRGEVRSLDVHRYLSEQTLFEDQRQNDLFRAMHLMQIVRHSGDARRERQKLLEMLSEYREYEQAIRLVQETLSRFPEDRLIIARLRARQGQLEEARNEAIRASEELTQQLRQEPDNERLRLAVAQSQIFAGKFASALSTLVHGLARHDSVTLRKAIGETIAGWHSTLSQQQQVHQQSVIAFLLKECGDNSILSENAAVQQFQHRLAEPVPQWLLHALSGAALAGDRQLEAAEKELRMVLELRPQEPVSQNNLAWVLLQRAQLSDQAEVVTPLLTEARALADSAIESSPGMLNLRETRARILMRLGEHEAAVQDLQTCLDAGLETPDLHDAMVACLQALGRHEEANLEDHSVPSQVP